MPATETRPAPEIEILHADLLALAVFEHYMETGFAATVYDIANRLASNPAEVRRRMQTPAPAGCRVTVAPGNTTGYEPTMATMRSVIVAQRHRCGDLDRIVHPERYLEGRDAAETHTN